MRIVFYISGHGYGHAVRDIEITKSLLKIEPKAHVHFRTCAPQWLFEPLLSERIDYVQRELDFGVRQKNSFSADKQQTFAGYADLLRRKERLVAQEVEFLKAQKPDVILSDITPFAFDAAEAYGKKAVAVGNFSWDWIYSDYLGELPQYDFVVRDIRASYAKAERLYRLPFYGDMSALPNIENTPLVGRKAGSSAAALRRRLGIPVDDGKKYVLLGLRMNDLQGADFGPTQAMDGVGFVAVSRDVAAPNCLHLKEGQAPYEDVLNACDAVLSKPGYSMVSEVIVNRTPIVYVPRKDFVEDPPLIAGLQKFAVCEQMSQEDYFAGAWRGAFERLFDKQNVWPEIEYNGAEVIAGKIVEGAK